MKRLYSICVGQVLAIFISTKDVLKHYKKWCTQRLSGRWKNYWDTGYVHQNISSLHLFTGALDNGRVVSSSKHVFCWRPHNWISSIKLSNKWDSCHHLVNKTNGFWRKFNAKQIHWNPAAFMARTPTYYRIVVFVPTKTSNIFSYIRPLNADIAS